MTAITLCDHYCACCCMTLHEVGSLHLVFVRAQTKDALFFIQIGEPEGEFALGLAPRTFDETPEQLADGE
eukprot:4134090-Pleurochrysis_carterae.AAC.1